MPGVTAGADDKRETLKLAAVAIVWLAAARYLETIGNAAVPDRLKAKIPLTVFLMACQVTAAAAGVGLSFALLRAPRADLALVKPSPKGVALAALSAPLVYVVASYTAIQIALPMLLAEIAARGAGSVRRSAGSFGRALEQGSLPLTLIWGVVLAAVTEELLFRGALFSFVERLAGRPRETDSKGGALLRAAAPVIVSAAVFGLMHGGFSGALGVVRMVSTTGLGLACGLARSWTKAVVAPITIHLLYNGITLAQARGVFHSDKRPLLEPVPDAALGLAVACAIIAGAITVASTVVRKRRERERAIADVGV